MLRLVFVFTFCVFAAAEVFAEDPAEHVWSALAEIDVLLQQKKIDSDETESAIMGLESLFLSLDPESFLADAVKARIDRLRTHNQYIASGFHRAAVIPNAEQYRFAAESLLLSDRRNDAIELLRQALNIEPDNTDLMRILAQTLSDSGEHTEAIKLFRQLHERLKHFPEKLFAAEKLAAEYVMLGKGNELIEYAQKLKQQPNRSREALLILVKVYTVLEDNESARKVLEQLLETADEAEFLWALQELAAVTERQHDYSAAVRYQERICRIKSDPKEQKRLFYLYDKAGYSAKAGELFFDQVLMQADWQSKFDLIDTMIRWESYDLVFQVLDFLTIHESEHWGVAFRQIAIAAYQDKPVGDLVRTFKTIQVNDSDAAVRPMKDWAITQRQFLPVIFYPELQRHEQFNRQKTAGLFNVQTFSDAKRLTSRFLIREAVNNNMLENNMLEKVRQLHQTAEERVLFELFLLDLLDFDSLYHIAPPGKLSSQIVPSESFRTIWNTVQQVTEPKRRRCFFLMLIQWGITKELDRIKHRLLDKR